MSELTKDVIIDALKAFEIESDSILLVHSSLKALGHIEGGADTVIDSLHSTVPNGTLVMPTLSQKNWETVFQDWSLDRPSDTGLITEIFRRREGSLRSDNATHSVAASGKHAADIVGGDPKGGARCGIFGDFCFSSESAWQRMYDSRQRYGVKAYVMFWGVTMKYHTFKHFVEYRFVEWVLEKISDPEKREMMKNKLACYERFAERPIVWPFYNSYEFQLQLEEKGMVKKIALGEGDIICCDIFDTVNETDKAFREEDPKLFETANRAGLEWYFEAKKYW